MHSKNKAQIICYICLWSFVARTLNDNLPTSAKRELDHETWTQLHFLINIHTHILYTYILIQYLHVIKVRKYL